MKVVNLFAPPSTGKSTTGKMLAGLLEIAGYKTEFVPEFAKFATYSGNVAALSDPQYMVGKQANRLHVLKNHELDFVVMDGPLPTVLLYTPDDYFASFEPFVMDVFNSYENANFLLQRNPDIPYQTHGRSQTLEESEQVGTKLNDLLERHQVQVRREMVRRQLPGQLFTVLTGRPAPSIELLA